MIHTNKNGVWTSFSSAFFLNQRWGNCQSKAEPPQPVHSLTATPTLPPFLGGARRFTAKKHLRWWVFCHSEAKESLRLGWVRGGKLNSLLLTASPLNLHCLLISCIPVEKSRLKTQVVKTPLVFSTNAGGSMAALSRSGVELAFRRSLFPI